MALNAATAWEVRPAGSGAADTNGGGFHTGAAGTDRSITQDGPFKNGTNLTVDATTNTDVAPDGYTPDSTDVGNIIQITAGAGFTLGFYEIASIQAGKWRLDRSPAAVGVSGGTWAYGGALASPGKAAGAKIAGNLVWVKAGTYSITTTSTNVSNGCISDGTGGNVKIWEGYQTTRGDLGTPPVFQASGISTFVIFLVAVGGTAGSLIRNITVDGNNLTSSTGFSFQRRGYAYQCRAINCTNSGITNNTALCIFVRCTVTGCSSVAAFVLTGTAISCESYNNTISGFSGGAAYIRCLAYGNTGASSDGFTGGTDTVYENCVSYGNGRDGFRTTTEAGVFINCLAEGNGLSGAGYGFGANAPDPTWMLLNCGAYNNPTGTYNAVNYTGLIQNFVTGTASFFVAAASGNFALNQLAGGGSAVRAVGFPSTFPVAPTTSYPDLGAATHHDLAPRNRSVNAGA